MIAIVSPIVAGLENRLRNAIDKLDASRKSVAIILDTPGGIVEIVERMVTTVRHSYDDVLEKNSRIDREVVTAYRKLEGELKGLGIRKKPRYGLEPPLGRNPTAFYNRAR